MHTKRPPRSTPSQLRATLLWGDHVVHSVLLGARGRLRRGAPGWVFPAELPVPELLVQGTGSGWWVETQGAGGVAQRCSREEQSVPAGDPVLLVAPGDAAVVRFGRLSLCFQVMGGTASLPARRLVDPSFVAGAAFAAVAVLGGLSLVFALTSGRSFEKPPSLQRPEELSRRYHVDVDRLSGAPVPDPPLLSGSTDGLLAEGSPVRAALLRDADSGGDASLSPVELNTVVLRGYSRLVACFERSPSSEGTVRVELTIGANGAVTDVHLLGEGLGNDLSQCVGDQLRRFEFPAAAGQTRTRLSLALGT